MPTRAKIKIVDDSELRAILDAAYDASSQIQLCKYACVLARHILEYIQYEDKNNDIIQKGFLINEAWQKGNARMHDVREASLRIHNMAKACDDILIQTALRVVGHAVATGHMREHAMVASDYAIKVINVNCLHDLVAVTQERRWQIDTLRLMQEDK